MIGRKGNGDYFINKELILKPAKEESNRLHFINREE
jgi:hypothetical protein